MASGVKRKNGSAVCKTDEFYRLTRPIICLQFLLIIDFVFVFLFQ
jgi:hypothetical protein